MENVLGIKKVLPEVVAHLQEKLPDYDLHIRVLDPTLG